ncbi:MAG: hypothetical protein JWO94_1111 [Verrucomicrobiaceae bacterium]|nr:hypothetical protein [Verrucomicrobiaceae bacterium]
MNVSSPSSNRQWRSLEEFGRAEESDEFMAGTSLPPEGMERREFLRVMAASLAMAGAAGCTRQPLEEIVAYVRQPEDLVLGTAQYYATAMDVGGRAQGLLVCSHEGRPTKIEGNPEHPVTRGRSSVLMQAALLDLYDPDRSKRVLKQTLASSWNEFEQEVLGQAGAWKKSAGRGLRLLLGSRSSPALHAQIAILREKYPELQCHLHESGWAPNPMPVACDFEHADVVLSLEADFLGGTEALPNEVLAFSRRRQDRKVMNRLYAVESMPSLTGAMADHRLALPPPSIHGLVTELLEALRTQLVPENAWTAALLRDLSAHRGTSAILAGPCLPPHIHVAVRQLNELLGNMGRTLFPQAMPMAYASLAHLVQDIGRGEVTALFMIGVNPCHTAAPELSFSQSLQKFPFTVSMGAQVDETAALCRWHLPESHFLEAWSDAQAADGTLSVVQPLIEPLYATQSAHELLALLLEQTPAAGYDVIRGLWQKRHEEQKVATDYESWWRRVLHDGYLHGPAAIETSPSPADTLPAAVPPPADLGMALLIRPDPYLLDGRHANNAWLLELPRPLTKLTWGNAAFVSPATAAKFQLAHGDEAELRRAGTSLTLPVYLLPGHADECVTVHLGYGRSRAGRAGNGVGFNAAVLQTLAEPWGGPEAELRWTGGRHEFACTQEHQRMEGRDLVRVDPNLAADANLYSLPDAERQPEPTPQQSLYPPVSYESPAWGMVIDLSRCIGCNACTLACQAENNIPVVGREQVKRGREMHWIRVDRYYAGPVEKPQILHQPVPCMHCENAPCEVVCPVAATVHDHQGLNLMVYNRCVGTRYCSNNCPYKVRRFNFLQYGDDVTPQLKLVRNPDVTVRMRGVMEKCTYCVQRISTARITAGKENRPIRDGEVVPACAQACPADAIVFGDILDKASRVSLQRASGRNYSLLGELNTRPRTTYLTKLRNPNPEVPS